MYLQSVSTKENLLNRRVSRADAGASERSGSNGAGDSNTVAGDFVWGWASLEQVADELSRLLSLNIDAAISSRSAPDDSALCSVERDRFS